MKRVLLVCLALILFLAVSCAPEAEKPPINNEQEEKPPVDSGNETENPKEETGSSVSGVVGESGAYTIPESVFKVEKALSYALENIDKGVKSGSSLSFTNLEVSEDIILNGTIKTVGVRALEEKNIEINLSLKEGEEEILVSYNAEAEVGENFELSNVKTTSIEAQIDGKKVEGIGSDYKPVSLIIADYISDIKELVVEYSKDQSIDSFSSSNGVEFAVTSDSWFDSAKKFGSVVFSFPGDKFLHNVDFTINADDSVSITIDGWANENNSGTGFVVSKEPAVRPENAKYSDEDAFAKAEKAFSMYIHSNFDSMGGVPTITRTDDEEAGTVTFVYNAYDASSLYGETTFVDGTYVYDLNTGIGTCNLSITGKDEKYTVELRSIVDEKSLISGYYDIIKIDGENYSYLKNVLYRSTVKITYSYNELLFFLKDILSTTSSTSNVTKEENKYTFKNSSLLSKAIEIHDVNGELEIADDGSFATSFNFSYGEDKLNFSGSGNTITKESGDKIPSSWTTFSLKELGETTEEQIGVINAILGKYLPFLSM